MKREVPFSVPDMSELEMDEVAETLRSGWITTGPRVKLLERRLCAYIMTGRTDIPCSCGQDADRLASRVVCTSSATAAEELNLRVLGVGPGDEVIVPAYTYTATASAAIHCGATVVFVDIRRDGDAQTGSPEMDYDAVERAITPRTKAIVAVDYGGNVCDYERLFEIADGRSASFEPSMPDGTYLGDLSARVQRSLGRVAIVADAAHSLGASREFHGMLCRAGALADFSSFSFHAVKNLTTAEGGASTWRRLDGVEDAKLYEAYQLLSMHGQNKSTLAKMRSGAWEYDIVGPWYKCNMTDIAAALGLRQLDRYEGMLRRRSHIVEAYDRACDELGLWHLNHQVVGRRSSNHLYPVRIPGADERRRGELIQLLAERGVATNVHYKPLPMMTAYRRMGWDISDFPHAFDYYRNLITLPLHTLLTDEDVDYVCEMLALVVKGA